MRRSDDLGGLDRVSANERQFLAFSRTRAADALIVLLCECVRIACDGRVELTSAQYEPLRSSAARYVVCPDQAHVDPGVDRVTERHLSHWVVERQSSVEVLDFFAPGSEALTSEALASELARRLTELRIDPLVVEDDPDGRS